MTGKEKDISRFLRSRGGSLLLSAIGLGGAAAASLGKSALPLYGFDELLANNGSGLQFRPGAGLLLPAVEPAWSPEMSLGVSVVAMIAVAAIMILVNRTFNLLRTSSILLGGLYLFMQCSVPAVSARFASGTLLALLALIVTALLYSCYQRPERTQTVFLAFFLCSGASLVQTASLIYLPVLLAGCIQMRCFTVRSVIAALLGIITPFWLLAGFAPHTLSELGPGVVFVLPGELSYNPHILQLMATVAFLLVWCLVMLMHNLYRVYSYNARARALNGLMAAMTVATMLLAIVDFAAPEVYLPPLFCFTALQTAMFFRINYERRSYIWVFSLLGACAAIYIWSIWI